MRCPYDRGRPAGRPYETCPTVTLTLPQRERGPDWQTVRISWP